MIVHNYHTDENSFPAIFIVHHNGSKNGDLKKIA